MGRLPDDGTSSNGTVDFAVSDVPFQLAPEDGSAPESPVPGTYGYVPIAGGGTAFVYNLVIGGERVTNLRLSGENVARIFTGVITRWNDAALVADNPQIALPDRPIVPVVRSDGAATSQLLSSWMIERHPTVWTDFCVASGRAPACGPTSFYPTVTGMLAQAGDVGVAGYVSQGFAEGSIGYVNYSYALGVQFPVAKILNAGGFYTAPTPDNVAVSLTAAQIDTNASTPATYLTADLSGVYTGTDPRNYELSSYSYLIVPTVVGGAFTEAKGRTLAAFGDYGLCEAQQQSAALGYAPLPVNLVTAGFDQLRLIPGADLPGLDIASCANPTFSPTGENLVVQNAPLPQACDVPGPVQCGASAGPGPTPDCPPPAVTALDVFSGDVVIVNWSAPAPCPELPVSYDVAILSGAVVIAAQTGVTDLSASFNGLEPGAYLARVTPNFAPGAGLTVPAGWDPVNVSETAPGSGLVTVTRPPGALVITQRCGVYNALPAYDAVDSFPGFPFDLPAESATTNQIGTAPIGDPIDDLGPIPDPEFPNYPLPEFPTYPTECGVSMGTARFVTEGDLEGEFFAAHGRMNEITVVDIRDDDAGWALRADIDDRFTSASNGDSFSGDYLGWQPILTYDSGPVGGEGPSGGGPLYDQAVIAGAPILPGTGFTTPAAGMTDEPLLARTTRGSGLGIAVLDARLTLLIPASVDAADYSATLTVTAV